MLKRLKTHAFIFSICLVVTCLMGGQQIFANATASDHDRYAADLSLAAKTCPARATISALARKVLEGRNGLRRIQSGWFGTEAANLLIHYGELEAAEILKLFDRAQDARIARIGELRAAYEIASSLRHPSQVTTARKLNELGWSGWRALILADNGKRFFELVKLEGWSGITSGILSRESAVAYFSVLLLADIADSHREKIAATAERANEITAALALRADQRDLTDYWAMVARYPDHKALSIRRFPETLGASFREQSEPIMLDRETEPVRKRWLRYIHQLSRANYRLGSFGFLHPFVNQTGQEESTALAATALNAKIDAGQLDPRREPERSLIYLYRQLVDRIGLEKTNVGFRYSGTDRHYAGNFLTMIRWAIAREALLPYLHGEVDDPPRRPELLPPDWRSDWEKWVKIAQLVQRDSTEALEETEGTDRSIAVELAFASGRIDIAITLAASGFSGKETLLIYKDFMKRLDVQCGAHSANPGSGFPSGGIPIYRFPSQSVPD